LYELHANRGKRFAFEFRGVTVGWAGRLEILSLRSPSQDSDSAAELNFSRSLRQAVAIVLNQRRLI
jgi:hypothetical protein